MMTNLIQSNDWQNNNFQFEKTEKNSFAAILSVSVPSLKSLLSFRLLMAVATEIPVWRCDAGGRGEAGCRSSGLR